MVGELPARGVAAYLGHGAVDAFERQEGERTAATNHCPRDHCARESRLRLLRAFQLADAVVHARDLVWMARFS
jgi:hypothetical protein